MLDDWHDTAHWIGRVGITHISSGGANVYFPLPKHIDMCYLSSLLSGASPAVVSESYGHRLNKTSLTSCSSPDVKFNATRPTTQKSIPSIVSNLRIWRCLGLG